MRVLESMRGLLGHTDSWDYLVNFRQKFMSYSLRVGAEAAIIDSDDTNVDT